MKALVWIYLTCLGVAALVFAIFPAEDTYINPVEVRPIETRVERIVPDPVNLSQQIEVNVRETAQLEARVTAVESLDQRVTVATSVADKAFADADTLRKRVDALANDVAKERKNRLAGEWALFGSFVVAWIVGLVALARTYRKERCREKRTSGDKPTQTSSGR